MLIVERERGAYAVRCFRAVRMQRVQAWTFRATPLITREVFWTFGSQRRGVARFEWLTLWPNDTPLPQISHR